MASILNTLFCAALATAIWTCIGLAVAERLVPRPLALATAATLGWAVHSAAVMPFFMVIGMSRASVTAVTVASLIAAVAALRKRGPWRDEQWRPARTTLWAVAGAALLALVVMAAIVPKVSADGIALAAPIFDHAKVAIIDEIARVGVPPGNPFFGEVAAPARLPYYYLWHFSAAELKLLTGVSGWEADAGLTWFTAFASLTLMMGLARWLSGQASAAIWVIVLAATASLRPVVAWLIGEDATYALIRWPTGFGGWLFQAAWAPQHLASAGCAVLAAFLLVQLAKRQGPIMLIAFALLAGAAFESSTWIGGITFPLAAAAIGALTFAGAEPRNRTRFAVGVAVAVLLAIGLASPLLYDQLTATAMRGGGTPIVVSPYSVLGDVFPEPIRRLLDLPAYWLVFLLVEFPAFYPAGAVTLAWLVKDHTGAKACRPVVLAFALLTFTSLAVAWLLVSTVGENNDLGWRAVLPGVLMLIVFAAVGLSRLHASLTLVGAVGLVVLGLAGAAGLIREYVLAPPAASTVFAATPALWEAVRRHSDATDRVANNPVFLGELTPWPVNISWALLSNRRSCYAGRDLALPFAPVPRQRREAIDAQFVRVFTGEAMPDDLQELATQYGCRLAVVTAQDGAWTRDPFAAHPLYRLVEAAPAAWRIYKVADPTPR